MARSSHDSEKLGFDAVPFGFRNYLIFRFINFINVGLEHMEKAIELLSESNYD